MLTKRRIFEFNDFRVDTGQFLLTRAGHTEPITPTVFRILQILLERAGEVVPKEDLMKYVWPDSFVEEGNLNRNVSTLRKALGEKPCDHRCIETIPKTGYRFVAPVRSIDYQPPTGIARKPPTRRPSYIVGRENERGILRGAYEQAKHGHGGLVCITGDVGMGKTTLVDGFLEDRMNDQETFHLARARCSESYSESEPFIPWVESFGSLAEQPAIKDIIQNAAPTWYREITHTGSAGPRRMKRELVDLCRQISPVHPLVIVIDDFQWADVGSVDLLAYLATRLESTRVLVIVCYRLIDMKVKNHAFLQARLDLLGSGACTEMRLATLNPKDVEQFLALETPNTCYPQDYAALLHAKSDGNPLFMRELLQRQTGISDSVQHMIEAKIKRLDDTHYQLLVTASVQGREFDSAVLAATMHMESQDVEESLQELDEVHGFIHKIREEELPNGKYTVRYRFVYGLYQEACYVSLAPTRKASLSASLAEAFLAHYGTD